MLLELVNHDLGELLAVGIRDRLASQEQIESLGAGGLEIEPPRRSSAWP